MSDEDRDSEAYEIFALLSASAPEFDVDAFLAVHPRLRERAEVWRRGEPKPSKRQPGTYENSGLNVWVGEATRWPDALVRVKQKIEQLQPELDGLGELAVPVHVDFGFTIGLPKAYVRWLSFDADDVRWFGERGIGLTVTAYPPMDELGTARERDPQ